MKNILNKKLFIILPFIMAVICAVVVFANGKTYTLSFDVYGQSQNIGDYKIFAEEGHVIIDDAYIRDSHMYIRISFVSPGADFVNTYTDEGSTHLNMVIAHKSGVITEMYFYGNCTGSWVIPLCVLIYLLLAFCALVGKYRRDSREDLYQYKNITTFGLIVFIGFLIILQIMMLTGFSGLYSYMYAMLGAAGSFSLLTFPVAIVLAVLIIASNINLMRKEGRNVRNMMGILLGIGLCFLIVFPSLFSDFIYNHTSAEVHQESGIGRHLIMLIQDGASSVICYLECILIGTIAVALRAARHIPPFDRDYIMILGCMIKKDGSLTKLLQGRADRAIEFARMQKEATGKDIIFVPSGGQGLDEVMPEAEAIKNYLISEGISEDRILVEDKSANTFENIKFSNALIQEASAGEEPKMAFSTTNYHVFRSGMYASKQGVKAEGIGSKTKRYFWVNAFVREFVATLHSERKTHLRICLALFIIVFVMVTLLYYSVQL